MLRPYLPKNDRFTMFFNTLDKSLNVNLKPYII
jgi:hypothetical protein